MLPIFVSFSLSTMEEDSEKYRTMFAGADFKKIDFEIPLRKTKGAGLVIMDDKESDRTPIVIEVKYDFETNKDHLCKKAGQVINWTEAINYTCKETDLFDEKKEKVLRKTMSSVTDYFSRMLKVRHKDITPYISSKIYEPTNPKADHVISMSVETFSTTTLGYSGLRAIDTLTARPVASIISFQSGLIPSEAEDENSYERYFFNVVVHEIIHSMGFNDLLYPFYIDKSTGNYYKDSVMIFKRGSYEKEFISLCTPKAKEVVQRRFNRTTDKYGNQLCLEIEDNGGSGTALSHPKSTIFRQDLMVGIASQDSYLTDVVLSVLDDMGWYTVNWSIAEQMVWGSSEFLTKEESSNIFEKPAWKNLPRSYLYTPNEFGLGIDYKSYGNATAYMYNITSDDYNITQYDDLYLPEDNIIRKNIVYDFTLLKNYDYACRKDKWAFVSKDRKNGTCLKGTFNEEGKFIVEFNGDKMECTKGKTLGENEWECPDPAEIKKIDDFLKRPPHDYGHVRLYGEDGLSNGTKLWIYFVVFLVLCAIIAALVWYFCCYKNHWCRCCCCKVNDEKSEMESSLNV